MKLLMQADKNITLKNGLWFMATMQHSAEIVLSSNKKIIIDGRMPKPDDGDSHLKAKEMQLASSS